VEKASRPLRIPTFEDLVETNRRHIQRAGGRYYEPDNLMNQGSLEWVLEAIKYPLFGMDPYPTLAEKAAILAWTVIAGHVFCDGNKRTGMSALQAMIRLNGYQLNVTDEEIVEVALRIAGGRGGDYSFEEFVQWVRSKLILKTT
jgi:death-on-curing protein